MFAQVCYNYLCPPLVSWHFLLWKQTALSVSVWSEVSTTGRLVLNCSLFSPVCHFVNNSHQTTWGDKISVWFNVGHSSSLVAFACQFHWPFWTLTKSVSDHISFCVWVCESPDFLQPCKINKLSVTPTFHNGSTGVQRCENWHILHHQIMSLETCFTIPNAYLNNTYFEWHDENFIC